MSNDLGSDGLAYLSAVVTHLRAMRDEERGSITLEQILITATLVVAALATGVIILNRANDAARGQ